MIRRPFAEIEAAAWRARVRHRPRPWTVEEFLDWERQQPEKYEYIDGVIRMLVGGTSDHATIAGNVVATLRAALRGGPCRGYIEAMKVDIGTGIACPDVVVTCSAVDPKKDEVPEPVVIVEVLSRSTESLDRGAKWIGYQNIPSLYQYILISQEEPQVEIFERNNSAWRYSVIKEAQTRVRFAMGDVEMTVAAVYEDTSLDAARG